MNDEDILKQLLYGHHLEPNEIKRAKELIHSFNIRLEDKQLIKEVKTWFIKYLWYYERRFNKKFRVE